MKKHDYLMILLTLSLTVFQSCSSVKKVTIKSYPEGANVVIENSSGETKNLGVTPVSIDSSVGSMAQLQISKEGHESQGVFVVMGEGSSNVDILVKLKEVSTKPDSDKGREGQELLAKSIAMSTTLISKKRFGEAEAILRRLILEFPSVSVPYDLLGNISYLKGDFSEASSNYKKSLLINPGNVESKQMIEKINRLLNQGN